jgi:5'/3'-nucleotidase SurE
MHILVTNDDGVQAPGLLALAQELRTLGKVTVFAPDRNWSASGHVKTLDRPLRVRGSTPGRQYPGLLMRWCTIRLCGPAADGLF